MDIYIVSHGFRGAMNPQKPNVESIHSPFSGLRINSSFQILKGKVERLQALRWLRMAGALFIVLFGDLS